MTDDIVARLRDIDGGYGFRAICREAAEMIERLRHDRDDARREASEASNEIEQLRKERETYRTCYLKCLASTAWKPKTHWKTYRNPQRGDVLFVATVGDLVRSYQAVPDGALVLRYGLPHDEAREVVEILNAWTASNAAWDEEQ